MLTAADGFNLSADRLAEANARAAIEAEREYARVLAETGDAELAAGRAALIRARALAGISRDQDRALERLRLEASLLGATEAVRRRAIAALEAEQELRDLGVSTETEAARAFIAGRVAHDEQEARLARLKEGWDGVRSSAEGAIEAMVGGDLRSAGQQTLAMSLGDAPEDDGKGGTEPRYRAGIEAALTSEPAAVLEEILKAGSAAVADSAGSWRIRVGGLALPVHAFTDEDIIISKEQELDPFPVLGETWNAVSARYPDPESLWETKNAQLARVRGRRPLWPAHCRSDPAGGAVSAAGAAADDRLAGR